MKKKLILRPFDYYALLFFTTAFVGWLWEVLLYLITNHTFVNRGVYRGPYLPIYGIGCIVLILLLHRMRKNLYLFLYFPVFFVPLWNTSQESGLKKNGVSDGGTIANIYSIFKDISVL